MHIKELFNETKSISRYIESVISYGMVQPERLKTEITEYVVTTAIEEQFGELLRKMQYAMDSGGEHEVGVWVSGFYGSGKSSFTKYLGFAFDQAVMVDGQPFSRFLNDRINNPEVKALITAINQRFPAAVVMVDLASDMIAGSTMEDVATVLYFKVMQWAGYSQNLKVAALERRLEKDGKMTDFLARFAQVLPGSSWKDSHNDLLCIDELIPTLAHEFYPELFRQDNTFNSDTAGYLTSLEQQVEEMLDVVRQKSGKEHILFIVDEVGQYVSSRPSLITNLDGLAKLIKRLGEGRAWVFATAQQTLTEDDQRAALNSAELYKLKDRFPIRIDLESSDIKEICYRRLLGKSPGGEQRLTALFDAKGQTLRAATRLEDAGLYDADFDKASFINLYPFLPAHFEILLRLLGALAKSTGGIGLRSAIKVVRDILVEQGPGRTRAADQELGWLATTVTLFDALEKDIERAFPSIYRASQSVLVRFPDSPVHAHIAKCVTILQILGNLPITAHNVAALTHGTIDADPRTKAVEQAVHEMVADSMVPLSEDKGRLSFISEKLRDVEAERGLIPLKSAELRRIRHEALREAFDPLPEVKFHGTMSVRAGVKAQAAGGLVSLAGDSNDIQIVVEFAERVDFDAVQVRLKDDSMRKEARTTLFLAAPADAGIEELAGEIWQSKRIAELHRSDPDAEIHDYCRQQDERANELGLRLKQSLLSALAKGVFLFQGSSSAVGSLGHSFTDAARKMLADSAERVYSRYDEAPDRVDTQLAEKFLRLNNLSAVSSATDPLGLVKVTGGHPAIDSSHKAIVSIKDHLDLHGSRDGKALLEVFSSPPFGWSPDTLRYIVAAMLMGGMVELKISGTTVTTSGQHAIDALKTNRSFSGSVNVSLRGTGPTIAELARSAERVSELTGQQVNPLEHEICATVQKHFPKLQGALGGLAERLQALGAPGTDRAQSLADDLASMLFNDASNAPHELGVQSSSLYDALCWARGLAKALDDGLEDTIRALRRHAGFIDGIPSTGIPGGLKTEAAESIRQFKAWLTAADFHERAVEFRGILTELDTKVRDAALAMAEEQKKKIHDGRVSLIAMPGFKNLNQDLQQMAIAQLEKFEPDFAPDMAGFEAMRAKDYDIASTLSSLQTMVSDKEQERIKAQIDEERKKSFSFRRTKRLKGKISSVQQLDALIDELASLKAEAGYFASVDITIEIEG